MITSYESKRRQRNQDGRNVNGLTDEEAHYNRIVVHERVVIENAFSRIKGRYPILKMLRHRIHKGDDPENYTRHMKKDILRIEKLLKSIMILQNFIGKEGRTGNWRTTLAKRPSTRTSRCRQLTLTKKVKMTTTTTKTPTRTRTEIPRKLTHNAIK